MSFRNVFKEVIELKGEFGIKPRNTTTSIAVTYYRNNLESNIAILRKQAVTTLMLISASWTQTS